MNDPWKYVAFPAAAVAGYLVSLVATEQFQAIVGLAEFYSELILIAVTGLVAGFMVDEVIPAYLEHRGQGGGSGSMGGGDVGGAGDDFDFD